MLWRISSAALCLFIACHAVGSTLPAPTAAIMLVNPYPATGAADIAGISVMSRALRAMQNFATPSTTDALVRHLQQLLVLALSAEVTVTRNSRAGGTAAARAVNAADSTVLLFGGSGLTAGTTTPAMRDLQPVALVARIPLALVVRGDDPAGDIGRWLERLEQRVRPLQIGTPGERTAGHRLVRQLQRGRPGVTAAVTYNGGNGALRGVLAGQVSAAVVPLPAMLPYAVNRQLRILAMAASQRHALLPAVPTFAESGMPAVTAAGWHGLFASPAMSADEIRQLQTALRIALRARDARDVLAGLGYVADFGDAGVLRQALRAELRMTITDTVAVPVQRSDSSGGLTLLNIFSRVRS